MLAAAGVEQVQAPPGQPREAALRRNVRHSRDQNYDVKERPCWKIVVHGWMHRFHDGATQSGTKCHGSPSDFGKNAIRVPPKLSEERRA